MYERGKLKIVTPACDSVDEDGDCDWGAVDAHVHKIYDSAVPDSSPLRTRTHPAVFLPHSCGDWVIGGVDEIRALIEDLQSALRQFEA